MDLISIIVGIFLTPLIVFYIAKKFITAIRKDIAKIKKSFEQMRKK